MDNKLSTGQEYNPVFKEKLKGMFSKENISKKVSSIKSNARMSVAYHAGNALDGLMGEWAGNMARSKGIAEDPKKKKEPSFKDYIKMFRLEMASLIGQYKKEVPTAPGNSSNPKASVAPEKTQAPQISLPDMPEGGFSSSDIEHMIKEMKKTSEDELLKYIKENQITDEKMIHDLIEATHAANEEVAAGLKKTLGTEKASGKTMERIAKNVEEIKAHIIKGPQDTYGSKVAPVAKAPDEQKKDAKEEKTSDGILGFLKPMTGMLGSLMPLITGLLPVLAGVAAAVGVVGALVGATKLIGDASILDKDGKMTGTGAALDSVSKAVGGNGVAPDATKSSSTLMEEKTTEKWFEFGKKDKAKKEIQDKLERGAEFDADEAKVIEKNLGITIPPENIKKAAAKVDSPSAQQSIGQDMQAATKDVSSEEAKQAAQPVVVQTPPPPPQKNSKSEPTEVLNYESQNTDNTFRRLNEKTLGLAHI